MSVTTVSRLLNGSLTLPIGTVERIHKAIRDLNYRPNPHARSLSLGRSEAVGLILPDIGNPFFAQLAASVEAAADAHGLALILCATLNRPNRELAYIERLWRTRVDGLLFITNHGDDGTLATAINQVRGIILLDEDVADTTVPKIFCDNEQGGLLATQHLMEAGHRRIAFVGGPEDVSSARERAAGFRWAIAAGRQHILTDEIYGTYTVEHGRNAMRALLARPDPPSAVFASSDEIAAGCLETVRDAGLSVPDDMSLVTFDDVNPLHLFHPPLTAIRQPVGAMGRRGVEMVVAQAQGRAPDLTVKRLPVELVVRSSVAPPPKGARTRGITKRRTANV